MNTEEKKEKVMVVGREAVDSLHLGQGFNEVPRHALDVLIHRDAVTFRPRETVETDESVMQLIPYVLVLNDYKILTYNRLKKSGEQRLRGKCSIGFGGHINDTDSNFETGMIREIHQELYFPIEKPVFKYRGILLNDANPVGRVHLGIVYTATVHGRNYHPRTHETDKIGIIGMHTRTKLEVAIRENRNLFEEWSAMCIDSLEAIIN
jgi:predicted NUDIX family phosphoesterase